MNSPGTDNDRIAAARHEAEILKEKLKRKQDALNDGHCELTFPGDCLLLIADKALCCCSIGYCSSKA